MVYVLFTNEILSSNNSHLSNSATTQQLRLLPSNLYCCSRVTFGGNSRWGVQWGGTNRLGIIDASLLFVCALLLVVLRSCPYGGTGKACSLAISSGVRNRNPNSTKLCGSSQLYSVILETPKSILKVTLSPSLITARLHQDVLFVRETHLFASDVNRTPTMIDERYCRKKRERASSWTYLGDTWGSLIGWTDDIYQRDYVRRKGGDNDIRS